MKILPAFIFLIVFSGCLDLDRWDKRYKTEAKDKCHCMESWQKEMSPNLQVLYQKSADIIRSTYGVSVKNENDRFSEEDMLTIAHLKGILTNDELNWNTRLGKVFFDENSGLYKCWNKTYSWSNESPGNNTRYTVPSHAIEMNCQLVYYFIAIRSYPKIVNAVFN